MAATLDPFNVGAWSDER